jgi:uncharacterized protein (TIGR02996 family)
MSDEKALLAAIRDHPDEDTPRLVYADWLDEHATNDAQRARAEFIRVQCELARIEDRSKDSFDRLPEDDAFLSGLRNPGDQFLKRYRAEWEAPLRGPTGPCRDSPSPLWFRRGFPHYLTLPFARLVEVGERLFRLSPITGLCLGVTDETLTELMKFPWLARLKTLRLDRAADWSATSPDWSRVADATETFQPTELYFTSGRVGTRGGEKLANAKLTELRTATFWNVEGGEAVGRALSGNWAKQLVTFTVYNSLGVDAAVIATLPQLQRLTAYHWGATELSTLVRGHFWPRLTHLNLFSLNAGDHTVAALASAKAGGLRRLYVGPSGITVAGIHPLARSRALETVLSLSLNANPIGDAGAANLAASSHLPELIELDLSNCGIGPAGVASLAASSNFPKLRRLILDGNPIALEGAAALAESSYLRDLSFLSIRSIGGAARSRLREQFGDRLSAS